MGSESLIDCFLESFLTHRKKKAISFFRDGLLESEISYGALNQDSNRMASVFLNLGIEKGDRVILYLPKSLAFIVAHLALQKIGAIGVPVNPGFKKMEMEYLLEDAGPALVILGPGQENTIRELNPWLSILEINTGLPYQELDFFRSASDILPKIKILPDDPGLLIYTSGTTGKPKGAILTQINLVHDAKNVIKIWEISESDVICHALPLFHVHGLCFELHTALMTGAYTIMLDSFSPETVVNILSSKKMGNSCTIFMAVPAIYSKLIGYAGEKNLNFDHIRLWTSGSAPLLEKDFMRIKDTFAKEPVEREGMSETGMNFSNPLLGVRKPGSIGLPLPGLKIRIVDPATFKDVVPGETGEIWLKGTGITPGYWRKPEETDQAFEEGWFRTGDMARVDEESYYYLTDRIKHIIISGGENISPKEVEEVINQIDGIAESSVVGLPDEKWGEKVVAAVVAKPESRIKAQEIKDFCRKHLHDWKSPKEIVFLKELPKNRMGKVLKEKVKDCFKIPT
ncbi:MAG: AMP-binding protein [Thermodesulfobacteriota bacterium]|nr:AMP-binding protein [Thermodesulfobacteriota bacterium]